MRSIVKIKTLILIFCITILTALPTIALEKFNEMPDMNYIYKNSKEVALFSEYGTQKYSDLARHWECLYQNNKLHVLLLRNGLSITWVEPNHVNIITDLDNFKPDYSSSTFAIITSQSNDTKYMIYYAQLKNNGHIHHGLIESNGRFVLLFFEI